jgi:3'(2'), 5'-bisphosphate nucleotidase
VAAFDIAACVALMNELTAIATRAAAAIHELGASSLRHKADSSPVTAADEASEAVIFQGLEKVAPGIPIVSEERSEVDGRGGKGPIYFLVDPLDGTREFIAGRGEFTVNIALIDAGAPRIGIIAAPAADMIWRGIVGRGAERLALSGKSKPTPIRTRTFPSKPVIMVSRSHLDSRTKAYLAGVPQGCPVACGSSLKFCRIAEGSADLYPRLAPTHDWDVAAGHAIVVAASGDIRTAGGSALAYGTTERLIPDFIVRGDPTTV